MDFYKKFSFFKDQVEVSPKTNKMILQPTRLPPLSECSL